MGANVEHDPAKETEALGRFQSNVNELTAFLKLLEADAMRAVVKEGLESVQSRGDQKELVNVELVRPIVSKITAAVDISLTRHRFVFDWTAVMLMTFLKAYLQENLERLAVKNPGCLKNSLPLEIDYLLHAESIEDVRTELRRQWADKTLDGGPKKWVPRLKQLGASGITKRMNFAFSTSGTLGI